MYIFVLALTLAAVAAAPATYDQRQDGEGNVQMDMRNIIFLVGLPKSFPNELMSLFLKSAKRSADQPIAQDRADVQTLTAFVEPNTPYRVIIGAEGERSVETEGSNAVVIAGRRRLEAEEPEELKLIGATEQCGPERRRNPITLTCEFFSDLRLVKPDITPEVVPVPT